MNYSAVDAGRIILERKAIMMKAGKMKFIPILPANTVTTEAAATPADTNYSAKDDVMMRKNIMKMAGKVTGFDPTLVETENTEGAAMAAETNYCKEDAMRALSRVSGGGIDSGVLEFQRIVGKLPTDDLQALEKDLEEPYYMMLRSEIGVDYPYQRAYLKRRPEIMVSGGFGADSVPDSLLAEVEFMMRKNIVKMAGKVKGFVPTLVETATTEAAVIEDAMRALRRISGEGNGSGVLEFQIIVGKLLIDDLQTLEKLLEKPYHAMLSSEMGVDYPYPYPYGHPMLRPEADKAATHTGGGDSFATKFGAQAIGAMFAKVAGDFVLGVFDTPTTLEPFEKAAGAVGLTSVIGGMMLHGKKPGLSKAMVKIGSAAIALATIVPMAGNLENVIMYWTFVLLATAIVMVTVTFA